MIVRNLLEVHGKNGTGINWQIFEIISNRLQETSNLNILHLSFKKASRTKAINELPNEVLCHTVTSLCYHGLKTNDLLPPEFLDIVNKYNFEEEEENLPPEAFDKLYTGYKKLTDFERRKYIGDIDIIILNEYQNFTIFQKEIVHILPIRKTTDLIITGCTLSAIYGFLNTIKRKIVIEDNFDKIREEYIAESYSREELTKNDRADGRIIKFLNHCIGQLFPSSSLYDDTVDNGDKPKVSFLQGPLHVAKDIVKKVKLIPSTYKLCLVGRHKSDYELIKLFFPEKVIERIEICTIHKLPECDILFFYGIKHLFYADEEEKNLFFTAVSNVKKQLHLYETAPISEDERKFYIKDVCDLVVNQRKKLQPYKQFKELKDNRNFTLNKINMSMMDTITFKIAFKDLPFFRPLISNYKTDSEDQPKAISKKTEDGFSYQISLFKKDKSFFFEFYDLNFLKKNRYDDYEMLKLIRNKIIEFFDYRVNIKKIFIHRIDLQHTFKFNNEAEREAFKQEILKQLKVLEGFEEKRLKDLKSNHNKYKVCPYALKDGTEGSTYINHHANKYNSLTMVMYDAAEKENENKIHIKYTLKVEVRLRGTPAIAQYAFAKNPNLYSLLNMKKGLFEYLSGRYISLFGKVVGEEKVEGILTNKIKINWDNK